jgi:thiamine-phosphate diphosphorylase
VVNERVDVAMAAGAHGVHLRSDSLPVARVRDITPPGFLVGRSVHDLRAAVRAAHEGADYVLFGTVFESGSKPGRRPAGVDALAEVAAAVTIPVLALGGITPSRAGEVARAGAAGVAAIGLFADASPDAVAEVVDRLTREFDSRRTTPRQ